MSREGAVYHRPLSDGRELVVYPMVFTARLCIGEQDSPFYDDAWCFASVADAVTAADAWNPTAEPEPAGWTRHPATGRRRPHADPAQEYVRP